MKVIVLGAGINGNVCALKIKERYPDLDVTILGAQFSPNTTGDGSGGLWYPYLCGNTPTHLISKWGMETYELFQKLWSQGGYGITLQPVFIFYRSTPTDEPEWTKKVYGYRKLNKQQIDYYNQLYSSNFVSGNTFTTFVVNPSTFLFRLEQRLRDLNVTRIQGSVNSLKDPRLDKYDVVINCTGLGAREIVPDDRVIPVRGQIVKVEAPWNFQTIMDKDSGHYIIPNDSFCVLGGTGQKGNFNTNVNQDDTDFILRGCHTVLPCLQNANILKYFVGLRPGRDEIRLEAEEINGKLYIHNYGHGGSGFTLFWGCGNDVLQLFENHSKVMMNKSKL
ncbi:unnamed protein product [Colias eurytheme]|nr:unnamed protein product [Colias eurytheme]